MTQNVLITGAGGPAAIAVARSLFFTDVDVYFADMDPLAPGLHLVAAHRRCQVPAGKAPDFVDGLLEVCRAHRIDVLIPTVDAELEPIAGAHHLFSEEGIAVLSSGPTPLSNTLDKWRLFCVCRAAGLPVPATAVFDDGFDLNEARSWGLPVVIKPRRGSGSRGVEVIRRDEDLQAARRSPELIIQAWLPGEEYSVDVLSSRALQVLAAVPRERLRVDSGVAVVSRTVRDPELEALGAAVVDALGLQFINNVQLRRDADGRARLLEVNPRAPGTLELTVASGVDMPVLALADLRGEVVAPPPRFTELACVRSLQQHVMSVDALGRLALSTKDARRAA